jgi:hypothetical protein
MSLLFKLCEISGFHHGVEIFTHLGCYLAYVSHQTNLHHTRTLKSEEPVYKLLTTISDEQNRMKTCLNFLYNLFSSLVWNTFKILNNVSLPHYTLQMYAIIQVNSMVWMTKQMTFNLCFFLNHLTISWKLNYWNGMINQLHTIQPSEIHLYVKNTHLPVQWSLC